MSLYVFDGPNTTPPDFFPQADNAVGILTPGAPLTLVTPTKHAGVHFDAGSVNEDRIIVITQNPTPYPNDCTGPLLTTLCQWPQFYTIESFPDGALLKVAQALDAMRSAGVDPGLVHVAATGGLLAGAAAIGDAIRPGLGLYGMVPGWAGDRDDGLRPILSLKALPLRIFDLAAGEAIGYGLRFRADQATRIATLGIGYGDGWPRAHANNGWVLVGGVRRPVVGAVSMDGITVDLGDLHDVTYADEFVLIGEQMGARIDADEVAAQRRTINYEVTTALRERLPRVHLSEAVAAPGGGHRASGHACSDRIRCLAGRVERGVGQTDVGPGRPAGR